VFFDIPERDRLIRDTLRSALQSIGALPWQRSVWVTKANITSELNEFIEENSLSDFLSVLEVKEIYSPKLKRLLETA
jgi:DNA-binding transcriptional regulator PaaX